MEIVQTRVMRGPNYWSINRKKLIVLKVKLEERERLLTTAELADLAKKLECLKPPLYNLKSYRSVLDVVAQVAVEIQSLAGMDCVHALVEPTAREDTFLIIFSYTVERSGLYAAETSVNLVNALISNTEYQLSKDISKLKKIHRRYSLSQPVQTLVHEAIKRDIPVKRLDHDTLLFGYGCNQHIFRRGDVDFPAHQEPGRIPIVAVTGTNGKTTTTRLITYLAYKAGYQVGFTTTDGTYLQNELVSIGDYSGPNSEEIVLKDPEIDFAVLECARGGILRRGLGFDRCNVSIVTNISSDHLGTDDIESLEQLAKLKSVVPRSTFDDGYAILNAEDDLVYAMKDQLYCTTALFSLGYENERITSHINSGQLAAITENGYFTVFNHGERIRVAEIAAVPLTHGGKAACMIQNVLPALLTAFIYKIPLETIQAALSEFDPTPDHTPGRMNVFNFGHFSLMIDYAHNEAGFIELKKYTDQLQVARKTGIIAAVADRTDQDIIKLGSIAAGIFDEIIIRHDDENYGRSLESLNRLLLTGIRTVNKDIPVRVISNEFSAIQYAMTHAEKDHWIFVNAENVYDTIAYVTEYAHTSIPGERPQVNQ